MELRRNNIFMPLAMLLTACASLIVFLPAAISMNSPVPGTMPGNQSYKSIDLQPIATALSLENSDGRDVTTQIIPQFPLPPVKEDNQSPANRATLQTAAHEKEQLLLQTAAIVGSSGAAAAASVAGGPHHHNALARANSLSSPE